MKYKTLGWKPSYVSGDKPETIYIIPVSSEPDEYRVIYPETLEKHIVEVLTDRALRIRSFEGCTDQAIDVIQDYLVNLLTRTGDRSSARTNVKFVLGVTFVVLGIINWTFPDPMPLIDELLLVIGGGALAGWSARAKKLLPDFRERLDEAAREVRSLNPSPGPLLTRIYNSIRAKQQPEYNEQSSLDQIEAEAQWFVKFLNVRDMIESESVTIDDVRELAGALRDIIPLKTLVRLERSYLRHGTSIRLKRLREKIKRRLDLSDDALAVYCGFYRSAQEYFEREGLQLP
jgi:hypothetical protein